MNISGFFGKPKTQQPKSGAKILQSKLKNNDFDNKGRMDLTNILADLESSDSSEAQAEEQKSTDNSTTMKQAKLTFN